MDFKHEPGRIYLENDFGKAVAEVTFPSEDEKIVNITHTYVDHSLRGQGVAGKLMEAVAAELKEKNKKAHLSCSYAIQWFDTHKEYDYLLADSEH